MSASLTTQYDVLPVIDVHSHIFRLQKKLSEFVSKDIDSRKIECYNYIEFLKKYSDERK